MPGRRARHSRLATNLFDKRAHPITTRMSLGLVAVGPPLCRSAIARSRLRVTRLVENELADWWRMTFGLRSSAKGGLPPVAHAATRASVQSSFALRATVDNLRLSVA